MLINQISVKNFSKRLSTRLLALTALWVTFIVMTIGYTMALSWRIEDAARTQSIVGQMPGQIYRMVILVDERYPQVNFEAEMRAFDMSLGIFDIAAAQEFLSTTEAERAALSRFRAAWNESVKPILFKMRSTQSLDDSPVIESYVRSLMELQTAISQNRAHFLSVQRRLQILLLTAAVASLFVIMWLLTVWVIRPTERLGEAMTEVVQGKLNARVHLSGSAEFESIGRGFNRMVGRLQDLVENLEAKVKEKTEAVEVQNRNLSQLYEMTTFLGQQHTVDELCEGFTTKLMDYTKNDGCAVYLINRRRKHVELAASSDLHSEAFSALSRNPISVDSIESVFKSDMPLRITVDMPADFLPKLRFEGMSGYKTAYVFHIRNGLKDIGFFVIYFKTMEKLPTQSYRLYENFGTHLGVAIDNVRLIERDQQYAVIQERTLMAQGLHDSIAQSLSFLNLQVQLLEAGIKTKDQSLVDDTVALIKTGVMECYEDVRELLLNFRERLHKESFAEGIATVIERFEMQTKLKVRLVTRGDGQELTDKQKLQVIFIMQEALANVRKHSKATQVQVDVRNEEDFELAVSDNGIGIDEGILKARSKRHVGLSIMRERASRIGAVVSVEPVAAELYRNGTTVRLVIPQVAR